MRRRECTANYHRNEQTQQYYYFIFCPFPSSLPASPAPSIVLSFHPRDCPGRGGEGGRGRGEDAACISTVWQHGPGKRGLETLPACWAHPCVCVCVRTCVGERSVSQHMCSVRWCLSVQTHLRSCGRLGVWFVLPLHVCLCGSACACVIVVPVSVSWPRGTVCVSDVWLSPCAHVFVGVHVCLSRDLSDHLCLDHCV